MSAIVSTKSAGGTMTLSAAFTASAAAGTIVLADITWDPRQSAVKEYIIPQSEIWLITDLYSNTTTDATSFNPEVQFLKDTDRIIDRSKPLNTVIITSAQRPNGLNGDLEYEGGSHLSAQFVARATSATAATANALANYEKR